MDIDGSSWYNKKVCKDTICFIVTGKNKINEVSAGNYPL